MKTVLCDINILLDIFLKRDAFYPGAAELFQRIESGKIKGYFCAISFPVLFYILSKELPKAEVVRILQKIRVVLGVALVDEKNVDLSLASDIKDIEDAMQ